MTGGRRDSRRPRQRILGRIGRQFIGTVVLISIAGAGCGDGEEPGEPAPSGASNSGPTRSDPVAPRTTPGTPSSGTSPAQTPGPDAPPGARSLPVKPNTTRTRPSPACSRGANGDGGGTLELPPRPGLSARRTDAGTIQVQVRFARLPRRCLPRAVRITVDVTSDSLAPATTVYPLDKVRNKTVAVALPDRVRGADVVRASSIAASGASSDPAAVLIRR